MKPIAGASALALALLAAACAHDSFAVRPAIHTAMRRANASIDPSLIDEHCPLGAPEKSSGLFHGPTEVIGHEGYVLELDGAAKIPLWVCESLASPYLTGPAKRRNRFLPDPKVAPGHRAVDDDYRRSGFTRGHMAASEDRVKTQELNDETFFFSNMVPQNGSLNSGMWARLEAKVRNWALDPSLKQVKAISGGFFYDPEEDHVDTADGTVRYKVIGKGGVAVPTHLYKVIAGQADTGRWKAIAFVATNRQQQAGWKFEDFIVSIDWLEDRTGLNFLPDLSPMEEAELEGTASRLW